MAKKKENKPPDLDNDFDNNQFACAQFKIDEYIVKVEHHLMDNKLKKIIWVNGVLDGGWFLDLECEENKRFAYGSMKFKYSPVFRKQFKKISKKYRTNDLDEKVEKRNFYTSVKVKSIVKQWVERDINKSVVLVDDDGNEIFKYK